MDVNSLPGLLGRALLQFADRWLFEWYHVGEFLLTRLFAALPPGWQEDLTPMTAWLQIGNDWFALAYAVKLMGLYLEIFVAFMGIKLVVKLCVPTLG